MEALHGAMEDIRMNKLSFRQAEKNYGIPHATIRRHLLKQVHNPGKLGRYRCVLNDQFESELLEYIIEMQQRFYGLSLLEVRELAYELAERNNIVHPFSKKKKMAGKDWMRCYRERHPEISLRTPEATSLARATGFNRVQVSKFFQLLRTVLEENSFPPHSIYNMDENGLVLCRNLEKY